MNQFLRCPKKYYWTSMMSLPLCLSRSLTHILPRFISFSFQVYWWSSWKDDYLSRTRRQVCSRSELDSDVITNSNGIKRRTTRQSGGKREGGRRIHQKISPKSSLEGPYGLSSVSVSINKLFLYYTSPSLSRFFSTRSILSLYLFVSPLYIS